MKILSFNVSWEAMLHFEDHSLGRKCAKNTPNFCRNKLLHFLHHNLTNDNYDIISLQEVDEETHNQLSNIVDQSRYEYIYNSSGIEGMVTLFSVNKFQHIYSTFHNFRRARPYSIHLMYDLKHKYYFIYVNLHFCNGESDCADFIDELEITCNQILKHLKRHKIQRIIVTGDTNYFSMHKNDWITKHKNTFEMSLVVAKKKYTLKCSQSTKTCCDNTGFGLNMNKYADFIFDSASVAKNKIVDPINGSSFKDLIVISDHLPITSNLPSI